MSEVAHTPQLRFPEFNGEWDTHSIGKIGTFFSGGTPTSSNKDYYSGTIPFIGSGKISSESVKQHITQEALDSSSAKIVNEGDLLYALYGATSGAVALSKINGAINQAVLCIRTNENKFFLKTWLEKNKERILGTYLQGGQGNLSAQIVKSLKLNLPTKPEQQKIAAFLTVVDNKIEQLSKKQELLGEYKKGLMQQIFSQAIRFQADDGSTFPDWEEQKVGSFMVERNKKSPKSEAYPLMSFVARKGVTEKGERYNREFLVNDEGGKKYKQTEYGDFIYSSNNLETGSIGLNKYGAATISPVYSIFQITDTCNYEFVSSFLVTKSFIHKMVRFRQGVVYGQWRIHESDFLKIQVKLPSLEEQTKIANFLSSIDNKIEQVGKQLDESKQFKKALLQQMFV